MPCTSSESCAAHEYCEPSIHQCHDCNDLCDLRYKTPDRCRTLCPIKWKMSGFGAEETRTSIERVITPTPILNHVQITAVVVVVVVVVLVISVVVMLVYKRYKKPHTEQKTNVESGKHYEESSSLMDVKHDFRDSSYRSKYNDSCGTENDINHEHNPKILHNKRMSHSNEELLPTDNFLQPFLSKAKSDHIPSILPSYSVGTSEDVSFCCDLRSDPVSVCSSRQDNRDQFRYVIDAYHAIYLKAHDLQYMRQCNVGNAELQVMISKNYNLDRANEEIRNIIPPNIPSDVVKVKHIS